MSNVTPPTPAGAERLTVKEAVAVPLFPSAIDLLPTESPCAAVNEKSSTESPSSAFCASISFQRIQNVPPLATLRPEIVDEMAVRLPAAFPSLAPVVVVLGVVKSRASTSVQDPVVRLV